MSRNYKRIGNGAERNNKEMKNAINSDTMMKDAIEKMEKQCFSCGRESCKLMSCETICGIKYYVKCTNCGAVGLEAFDPERAVYYWNKWGICKQAE